MAAADLATATLVGEPAVAFVGEAVLPGAAFVFDEAVFFVVVVVVAVGVLMVVVASAAFFSDETRVFELATVICEVFTGGGGRKQGEFRKEKCSTIIVTPF